MHKGLDNKQVLWEWGGVAGGCIQLPPAQLAQLHGYQTAVREVQGYSPDRTNTQGLKIDEDKVLPLLHLHYIRLSSLAG